MDASVLRRLRLLGLAEGTTLLLLIFVAAYFLLFRPQQQKQKQLTTALAALRRGDRVVSAGGILATVARVKEGTEEIEVDIAPNVRVTVLRNTITGEWQVDPLLLDIGI